MGRRRGRHVATRQKSRRWIAVAGVLAASLVVGGAIAGPSLFASAGQSAGQADIPTPSDSGIARGSTETVTRTAVVTLPIAPQVTPSTGGSSDFVPAPCSDESTADPTAASLPCDTAPGFPGG